MFEERDQKIANKTKLQMPERADFNQLNRTGFPPLSLIENCIFPNV